jgi:Domain of unknown function (DUF4381)
MMDVVFAALTAAPEPIPDLKPPRGAIPTPFGETYAVWIAIAVVLGTLLSWLFIRHLRRPKLTAIPTPAEIARQELAALRGKDDAGQIVAEGARVLRRYLIARFRLSGPGLTADEIVVRVGTDELLTGELHSFLSHCDVVNFAPAALAPPADAVIGDAERLIEAVERQTPPPLPG